MKDAITSILKLLGADGGGDGQAPSWPEPHRRLTRDAYSNSRTLSLWAFLGRRTRVKNLYVRLRAEIFLRPSVLERHPVPRRGVEAWIRSIAYSDAFATRPALPSPPARVLPQALHTFPLFFSRSTGCPTPTRRTSLSFGMCMLQRGPWQQPQKEETSADRKRAQLPTNELSRKILEVKGFTTPPMTQAMVHVAIPVEGLRFLQNHPKTAHKNACLMAPGVMDLFPGEPFTVLVINVLRRAVHILKHTVVGLVLPSPTHILTPALSAPGEADAKEGEETKIIPRPLRRNKGNAKETPRKKAELIPQLWRNTRAVKDSLRTIAASTAPGCYARREEPDSDEAHSGNPADADERTDTDAENRARGKKTSTLAQKTAPSGRKLWTYCPRSRTCGPFS